MADLIRASSDEPFSASSGPRGGKTPHEVMAGKPNPLGLPLDLRAALDSLVSCVAGSAADFSQYYRDSWLYGIILGWDCGEDHEHDDTCGGDAPMLEVAARHRWDGATVERLRGYRRAYAEAMGESRNG